MVARAAHAELGDFLRTRRARMQPESVGLPLDARRRSGGLRREEVAVLANISPAWYSRLEQGSKVRPSMEILESLARALQLNGVERRYLRALGAEQAPPSDGALQPDGACVTLVQRLVDGFRDADLPVYAADGQGNLLAWNAPMSDWYADFSGREGRDRNIVWWMFTAPEARERIMDWTEHAREIVAGIRYSVGTGRVDPVDPVVPELSAQCVEFAHWWNSHDVAEYEVQRCAFRHPRAGRRVVEILTMRPVVSTSVSVVYHFPQ